MSIGKIIVPVMSDRSAKRPAALIVSLATICTLALAGCAHRAPASIHDGTAVISGHNTAHASLADATRTVLVEAAAIAVDHGYRFFRLMTPIRPGADVTIRVYGKGDVDPHAAGVYDADAVGRGEIPAAARAAAGR